MSQTPSETASSVANSMDINQYGPTSTDQSQKLKKLLSSKSAALSAKSEAIGANYVQEVIEEQTIANEAPSPVTPTETIQSPNQKNFHNQSNHSSGGDNKKKKNRTPPKSKFNSNNGNQRVSPNKKYNNESHLLDENNMHMIDSPLYGIGGNSNRGVGSKKNNLNHLLNFSYASAKDTGDDYEYQRFSKQFWSNKIAKSSYFSKEQFLQANCQFVVKNTGEYSVHLVDPDLLVEWDKIEEVHIDSNEFISCPICLYPPNAGKMTKCGHIYCWPCILHYLSLSDKAWRKCPICFESIYKADLKSVLQNKYECDFKISHTINMELMFKSKSKLKTIILPYTLVDQFRMDDEKHKQISFDHFNSSAYSSARKYLKIVSKSPEEIQQSILDREKRQLLKQLNEEEDQPEMCFIEEALSLLAEREACLKLDLENGLKNSKGKSVLKINKAKDLDNDFEKLTLNPINKSSEDLEEPVTQAKKPTTTQSNQTNPEDFSYFYQSMDGQRIYLNALNARILMSQYEMFANCPQTLSAKIIASESFFMSEENRKRFRYLSHLPLHSEFRIVEVVLGEPYVTRDTLKCFEEEIQERKRLRQRKLMKEKRMADKWDQSVYEPHYINSSVMNEQVLTSSSNLIDYSNDFPEASTSPATSSSGISSGSNGSSQTKETGDQQAASFAQMIRHPGGVVNKKLGAVSAWPTLNNQAPANLVKRQSQLTNGWLSTVKQGPTLGRSKKVQGPPSPWSKNSMAAEYENEEEEETEYMPAPGYKESFFSGIDETLRDIDAKKMTDWEAMLLAGNKEMEDPTVKKTQQMSKKKKKTKQLLFCT